MPKKLTSDRVIPVIVDTGFVLVLLLGFNLLAQGVLAYAGGIWESEALDVGFWELAPVSLGAFIAVRFLQITCQTLDSPTRLSRPKRDTEKEEETE